MWWQRGRSDAKRFEQQRLNILKERRSAKGCSRLSCCSCAREEKPKLGRSKYPISRSWTNISKYLSFFSHSIPSAPRISKMDRALCNKPSMDLSLSPDRKEKSHNTMNFASDFCNITWTWDFPLARASPYHGVAGTLQINFRLAPDRLSTAAMTWLYPEMKFCSWLRFWLWVSIINTWSISSL